MKCIHDMSSRGKDIRHTLLMWFFYSKILAFWKFKLFYIANYCKIDNSCKISYGIYMAIYIGMIKIALLLLRVFSSFRRPQLRNLKMMHLWFWQSHRCKYVSFDTYDKNVRKMIWIHITHMGKGNQVGLKLGEYTYVYYLKLKCTYSVTYPWLNRTYYVWP